MSDYAGNPAVFPTTITIPDDGSPRRALEVAAGLEGLADRTARLDVTKGGLAATNAWTGVNGFQDQVFFTGDVVSFAVGTMLRVPPIVDLADTPTQTIGPEDGWFFRVPTTAAATRLILLRDTGTPTLAGNEFLRVFFPYLSVGSNQWHVRRESGGSNDIVSFDNVQGGSVTFDTACFADFVFVNGTGWRWAGGAGPVIAGPHV